MGTPSNGNDSVIVQAPRQRRPRKQGPPIVPPYPPIQAELSDEDGPGGDRRERIATEIFQLLRLTLGGLFLIFVLFGTAILVHPESTKPISEFVETYLRTAFSLVSGFFGPLLAFILGYYYGKRGSLRS